MYRSSKTIMDNAPHGMSEFACLVPPILLHTQYNAKPSASDDVFAHSAARQGRV